MQELKKISVLSVGKIFALFGIVFGLIAGFQFGVLSMESGISFQEAQQLVTTNPAMASQAYGLALGWFAIIALPMIFGLFWFVMGLIISSLYYMFTKYIGVIRLDLQSAKIKQKNKQ